MLGGSDFSPPPLREHDVCERAGYAVCRVRGGGALGTAARSKKNKKHKKAKSDKRVREVDSITFPS